MSKNIGLEILHQSKRNSALLTIRHPAKEFPYAKKSVHPTSSQKYQLRDRTKGDHTLRNTYLYDFAPTGGSASKRPTLTNTKPGNI